MRALQEVPRGDQKEGSSDVLKNIRLKFGVQSFWCSIEKFEEVDFERVQEKEGRLKNQRPWNGGEIDSMDKTVPKFEPKIPIPKNY